MYTLGDSACRRTGLREGEQKVNRLARLTWCSRWPCSACSRWGPVPRWRTCCPARLALWQLPAVSPVAWPSPGGAARHGARAGGASAQAGGVATARRRRQAGRADQVRAPWARTSVRWSPTWRPARCCYAREATTGFAPASTTKLATAVAALDVLGPGARFTRALSTEAVTAVLIGPAAIMLVGGGDPTLAARKCPAE